MIRGGMTGIIVFFLTMTACPPPEPSGTSTTTSTPEKTTEMRAYDIRKASDEIKKNILPNNFLRCDEEEKEHWFAVYEKNGKKHLLEFVHYNNENSLIKEKLWKFEPEGILPRDMESDVTYQGYIVFVLFEPDKGQKNFLYRYNREKNRWDDSENFDAGTFSRYGLPAKIHVRKKKDTWEYSSGNQGWTTRFPFEKPKASCQLLKNKTSLQVSNILGPEIKPTPEDVSQNNIPCEKGYLNEGANLRSSPQLESDKKLEIWHKNSELEILSIVEGDAGKESPSTVWYKVKMIRGQCDHAPYCKKEGYIHSSVVSCGSEP